MFPIYPHEGGDVPDIVILGTRGAEIYCLLLWLKQFRSFVTA